MEDRKVFRLAGINCDRAVYSEAGDSILFNFDRGSFNTDNYNRFHVSLNTFKIEWLTDGEVKGVFADNVTEQLTDSDKRYPIFTSDLERMYYPIHDSCNSITITALEPNSSYWCVLPTNRNNIIKVDEIDLPVYKIFKTSLRRVYFSNIKLNVDGKDVPPLTPFACLYNSVNINPSLYSNRDGKILAFYV
jgi:hypothetical protein